MISALTTQPPNQNPGNFRGNNRGGYRGGGRGNRGGGRGGRGARGRREQRPTNYDVVSTRPVELKSKAGTSGQPIGLITNYIGFKKKPDSTLFKYRVDFRSKVLGNT